ncbi:DUF3159 domain-containing protein [Nocardioides sp. ChNu-153]|uniref:DUF3159 domain-containing protein n=1 Tax=unclassified Nocardioides TaxID=2615069 RepID=UPI002404A18D|nr:MULTISPECIES: DUF3159 domain-containing protein [unclassified Nocardioides]MDF9717679.1 DUF3159 domain-containing protein [Nocardioides sp. ChNu-99]MDN7121223.1 DUF3159 domain-containing protein [Nocardioides sp. ChNu-153]
MSEPTAARAVVDVDTVEALVRRQLAAAFGGARGIVEAAVPTVLFTVLWLSTKDLQLGLVTSLAVTVVLLLARLVQRSTVQYVVNALVGIGIGWLFVHLSARSGGSVDDQALAYFLPGILYSAGYTVLVGASCVVGWPLMGFLIGSVTGDATAWHQDRGIVRLCTRLTWLLLLPGAIGVLLQGPVWLAGHSGALSAGTAVAVLAALRLGLGWPLRIASFAAMIWMLSRDRTPLADPAAPDAPAAPAG